MHYKSAITLAVMLLLMAAGVTSVKAEDNTNYYDHAAMVEAATAKLRAYLKANPSVSADSLRANVINDLTDGPIGKARDLTPARKKKLTPAQLYDSAVRSSLIFGKMEYSDYIKSDSAYKNASAVALTSDGICATNYHVVADVILAGSLGRTNKKDEMRFLMDCEGNVYPVTAILAADPLNDWAIIKVDPCGHPLTPAPVGGDIPVGTPVYCLASPSGSHFHFTDGMVSNRTRTTNKRTGFTTYILEITSDYGVGASGGPIFDECGNLVALVSSTFSLYAQPEQFRNFQMSYKKTIPVFLIKECFK